MKAKGFYLLAVLVTALSLVGCSSVSTKQNNLLRKDVYAAQDALTAGRVDLAKAYTSQAARLIAPPKKREIIKPVESKGTRYVVLPQELNGSPALAIGSPALTSLVAQDKPLAKQLESEQAALASDEAQTDKVIAAKQAIVDKVETQKIIDRASLWGRVKFYGTIAAIAIGLGALCYFFPPAIPFVLAFFRSIASGITWAFGLISGFVAKLFTKPTPTAPPTPNETTSPPAS